MCKHRRHLAAIACVLLLNLQLFATNALGCAHQAEVDASLAACPHVAGTVLPAPDPGGAGSMASADGDAPEPTAVQPCQKCNLVKVAAGWHLVIPEPPMVAHQHPGLPQATPAVHLFTRTPDGLLRPPRLVSG